jgi:uncharacterized membrane protein YdjX (TVP38/TMEM64 family)
MDCGRVLRARLGYSNLHQPEAVVGLSCYLSATAIKVNQMPSSINWRRILLLAFCLLLVGVFFVVWQVPSFVEFRNNFDSETIKKMVQRAGIWGPLLVIALMTFAVVMSPLPSAPIALASGAAYGHFLGTLYVLAGAEAGALIAFGLARVLGRETLHHWFGERLEIGLLGSQNTLMLTVFLSRLLPFISFDLVSYAAGLSYLRFWRFAFATLAGIIPASFLLAHFGAEITTTNFSGAAWSALLLGAITGLPVLWIALRRNNGRK